MFLAIAFCIGMIATGVFGLIEGKFSHRRVVVTGLGAGIMSSALIFMGLAGLRVFWVVLVGSPWKLAERAEGLRSDWILKSLLALIAVALAGGFFMFVLGIPF